MSESYFIGPSEQERVSRDRKSVRRGRVRVAIREMHRSRRFRRRFTAVRAGIRRQSVFTFGIVGRPRHRGKVHQDND